uniref:Uncharacterized protein n=1 Tax=Anopheles farauti TaxID=69004 RepID=A0A182QKJ1_9DIPT
MTRTDHSAAIMHAAKHQRFLNRRGLCCFPSLTTKKPIQSLLADEVSVLSTNNSEAFLQNLTHIGSDRRSEQPPDREPSSGAGQKVDDMVLLEKQGRCSQKLRGGSSSSSGTLGNLAHVSQTVGQNMTDISNIGATGGGAGDGSSGGSGVSSTGNKVSKMLSGVSQQVVVTQRGSSLPPSALPRPPRSLKPPRKIEYGRLSDGGGGDGGKKTRAATPPSPASSSGASQSGGSGSLKRTGREFSPAKGSYVEMKDTLHLTGGGHTLKHKSYGSMTTVGGGGPPAGAKFGFGSSKSGSGTGGTSRNYQRLEDPSPTGSTGVANTLGGHHQHNSSSQSQSSQSRKSSGDSGTLKRSLLPNTTGARKTSVSSGMPKSGGSRDSLNSASSGSNHSNVGQTRSSPQPPGSGYHPHQLPSRTPPRFLQHHHHQPSTSVESNKSHSNYHSLTPQSTQQQQQQQFHHGFFAKFPSQHAGSPVRTTMQQQHQQNHPKTSSSLPSSSILHAAANSSATSAIGQSSTASLPPKPSMLDKMVGGGASSCVAGGQQQRRGSSLARVENKYRIQF